jgi:hypothetical protein
MGPRGRDQLLRLLDACERAVARLDSVDDVTRTQALRDDLIRERAELASELGRLDHEGD